MNRKKRPILLAALVVGLIFLAVWMFVQPSPSPSGVLEVNGRVEGDQAAVGAKVGGKVARVAVREGENLRAGDLITELASGQARARFQQAEHALHAARERLAEAQARVASAQRQLEEAGVALKLADQEAGAGIVEAEAALGAAQARRRRAEADLERARKDHARYRELFAQGVVASQRLDEAQAAEKTARATADEARKQVDQAEATLGRARAARTTVELRRKEVETAKGRLEEARASVATARAQVQAAEADQRLARTDLDDLRVGAPFDGTVLKRLVEPGEVVAAGTPLITLVDLTKLYAKVYVAERDIGKVKTGDTARIYTDAFPGRHFRAAVSSVSQQAEFTPRDVHMKDERVRQVFAVKLAIRNPEGILKPGMPVDARIRWDPKAPWGDGMD